MNLKQEDFGIEVAGAGNGRGHRPGSAAGGRPRSTVPRLAVRYFAINLQSFILNEIWNC